MKTIADAYLMMQRALGEFKEMGRRCGEGFLALHNQEVEAEPIFHKIRKMFPGMAGIQC
jgi:hypothetical protein